MKYSKYAEVFVGRFYPKPMTLSKRLFEISIY